MRKTANQIADTVLLKLAKNLCDTDPEAAKDRRKENRKHRKDRPGRKGMLTGGRGNGPGKGAGVGVNE